MDGQGEKIRQEVAAVIQEGNDGGLNQVVVKGQKVVRSQHAALTSSGQRER